MEPILLAFHLDRIRDYSPSNPSFSSSNEALLVKVNHVFSLVSLILIHQGFRIAIKIPLFTPRDVIFFT